MATRKEKSRSSWRDIQQGGRRPKTTKVARKRHLVILLRSVWILLLVLAVAAGIVGIKYFSKIAKGIPEPPGSPRLVEVDFQTNGVLTEDWFRKAFPDVLRQDIRQVDVSLVKGELEREGQISLATVNVSLPSLLRVRIEEREPVLRLRVQSADGKPRILLVAKDGTIYKGASYPQETLRRLPGVSGLKVRQSEGGYLPIPGLEPVVYLLDRAKEQLPAVYQHWQVVDLGDWNPELDYRPSLVRITSPGIEEIVFSTTGIDEQIYRLAEILQRIERYQLGQPKLIDLSFTEEAVIRYK